MKRLNAVFSESHIETIRPVDIRTYLAGRVITQGKRKGELAKTRANREISLLSHVINFARDRGLTDMANPCLGISKHEEPGRDRYLTDAEFDAIYAAGDELLRDAMDLLSSTSQRPGDVVRMKRTNIRDGALWGRQAKTGTPQRFDLVGDLKAAIDRMQGRSRKATSAYLVQDDNGQPLTYWQLEDRWSAARTAAAKDMPSVADAQMRDVRGKTATDLEDLAHAQALLGHKTRAMTERYVKARAGVKVTPHTRKRSA
jgi:integrase